MFLLYISVCLSSSSVCFSSIYLSASPLHLYVSPLYTCLSLVFFCMFLPLYMSVSSLFLCFSPLYLRLPLFLCVSPLSLPIFLSVSPSLSHGLFLLRYPATVFRRRRYCSRLQIYPRTRYRILRYDFSSSAEMKCRKTLFSSSSPTPNQNKLDRLSMTSPISARCIPIERDTGRREKKNSLLFI
jgi:hypothetical protein